MRRANSFSCAGLLAISALLLSCTAAEPATTSDEAIEGQAKPAIGLVTSLPIYWGEGSFDDLLDDDGQAHPARQVMEREYRLVPLDTLSDGGGQPSRELATLDRLMVAQPRALTPADNVALDEWVRDGGSLLLVIDPMLTSHTSYPVGDPRRPSDVGLVPPVLARWGLEMREDERTFEAAGIRAWNEVPLPVHKAGRLKEASGTESGECRIEASGLIADCRIGKGSVLIVADAAWLDVEQGANTGPGITQVVRRVFE